MELKITVYDDDDNVIKEAKANTVDLRFGQVSAIMELLNVEDATDSADLMRTVYGAWKQLTKILSKVFPDVQGDDWDGVRVSELLPVLVQILKASFAEMMTIPKSKNA